MYRIVNQKGDGIVLKNSGGKICFPDKKTKFGKVFEALEIGVSMPDEFFKIVKEMEKVNIVDIDENCLLERGDFANWSRVRPVVEAKFLKVVDKDWMLVAEPVIESKKLLSLEAKVVEVFKVSWVEREIRRTCKTQIKLDWIKNYLDSLCEFDPDDRRGGVFGTKLYRGRPVHWVSKTYAAYAAQRNGGKFYIVVVKNDKKYAQYNELKSRQEYKQLVSPEKKEYIAQKIEEYGSYDEVMNAAPGFFERYSGDGSYWATNETIPESNDGYRRGGSITREASIMDALLVLDPERAREVETIDRKYIYESFKNATSGVLKGYEVLDLSGFEIVWKKK